jgi:2-methylisocitrate lyase-like PEP mutase family enzyme
MTTAHDDRAATFLALHQPGAGFVLPNAWDGGSARILEQVGFAAIATTSAGIAFSLGRADSHMHGEEMLECIAAIVEAVDCGVTADLESGYGTTPDDVAATVTAAIAIGVVGGNLEDAITPGELIPVEAGRERIEAARNSAPTGTFVLNARTDTYLSGLSGTPAGVFAETVERATRYVEAGADSVFVPGVDDEDTIRRLAVEIPAPLNLVAGLSNTIPAPTLLSLGVRRVSLGGSLARAAYSQLERAGRELLDSGTLGFLDGAIPYGELQRRFGR